MARTFDDVDDFIGFAPQTFETWVNGTTLACLVRRNSTGGFDTVYYAGANGGGTDGFQQGITNNDDPYFGIGGTSRTLTTTITAANQCILSTKALGTTTPTANFGVSPFNTTNWTHGNYSGTLGNPPTAAQAVEEIARWNAAADPFDGDIEWVGIWSIALTTNNPSTEHLERIAPRFLVNWLPRPQRFWWFDGAPTTDTVRDLSNHGADQIALTGTTETVRNPLMPNLVGSPVCLVIPGVF